MKGEKILDWIWWRCAIGGAHRVPSGAWVRVGGGWPGEGGQGGDQGEAARPQTRTDGVSLALEALTMAGLGATLGGARE